MERTDHQENMATFESLIIERDALIGELRRKRNDLDRINIAIELFRPAEIEQPDNGSQKSASMQDGYDAKFSALQQLNFALKYLGAAVRV
jgi:hypothetical protein